MALPSTGSLSMSQIAVELGLSATTNLSLNDARVRTLANKSTGVISFADLRGKSSTIVFTNSNNITNANIFNLMGSPTKADNYLFINTATIGGTTTGFALRTGVFPAGSTLKIINTGNIYGVAGSGGSSTVAPLPGGDALLLDMDTSLDNTLGKIYAGGGGGQGVRRQVPDAPNYYMAVGGGAGAGFGTPIVYANTSGSQTTPLINLNTPATIGNVNIAGEGGRMSVINQSTQAENTLIGGVGGANGAAGGNYTFIEMGAQDKKQEITKPAASGGRAIVKSGKTLTYLNNSSTSDIKGAVV